MGVVTGHIGKMDNGQVTNVERIVVRRLAVDQPAGDDQTCKDQLQKCFLGSGWGQFKKNVQDSGPPLSF